MKLTFNILLLFLSLNINSQTLVYENIAYDSIPGIDPNFLSLDAYVPVGNEPKPIAIFVHGGGWCIGDKSNIHEKADLLNDLGYIFISINYRLSPFPYELDNEERIKYPDHPRDVAKAVSFILDKAIDYNGDPENVFLFGHSSGAHLVATILTNQTFLEEHNHSITDIKCASILDTGGFDLESWITESATDANLFINAFSSDDETWTQASPIQNIESQETLPDILLIYQDNINRVIANQNFGQQITQNTTSTVSEISTSYNHQEINQLLGSTETSNEEFYTLQFTEWLDGCMLEETSSSTSEPIEEINLIQHISSSNQIILLTEEPIYLYNLDGKFIQEIHGKIGNSYSVDHLPQGHYIISNAMKKAQRILIIK